MPDPRLFSVKQCVPAYGAKSGAAIVDATNSRRSFFDALGKIGDIQVLNDIGAGSIGKGLRNLASISNAIRVGTGSLPTSIGSTIDAGANWVLNTTGIATPVVEAVRGFNPAIANQAYGQAKAVFGMVKGGSFKTNSIPGVLQDLQNLERLGRNIFTPGINDVQAGLTERCEASPYAMDLMSRAPKYKFLFIVEFKPAAGYEELSGSGLGPLDMAFAVKHTSRPNVKFVQEDVNYYNYRTKVITKTEFEDITMCFHDDTQNSAIQFYRAYLRAMSPITGLSPEQLAPDMLERMGMSFQGNHLNQENVYKGIQGSAYAASTGLLDRNAKQVFKEIRIYHVFDYGNKMNVMRFANPRISNLNLDDLDMSVGNEGSEMSLTFNYDSMYIDADVDVGSTTRYNIGQIQRGAVYPLRYNGSGGKAPAPTTGAVPSSVVNTGGFGNDGLNTLRNGVSQVAGAITTARASVAAVQDLTTKFTSVL